MTGVKTVDLLVDRFMANHAIDHLLAERMVGGSAGEFTHYLDHLRQQIVISFAKMFAYETVDTQFVSQPATWWEHFKRDALPRWISSRLAPAKMQVTRIETRAYYPNISLPDQRPVYRLHRYDPPSWDLDGRTGRIEFE